MIRVKYILEALYEALDSERKEGPMVHYVLDGVAVLIADAEESLDKIDRIGEAPLRRRLLKGRKSVLEARL